METPPTADGLIEALASRFKVVTLGGVAVIRDDQAIRVLGLDRALDIFLDPNELEISEFDDVWNRDAALDDGTRVPDVIDLLVSKQATGRDKDLQDIAFLEAKAEREYLAKLPTASTDIAAAPQGRRVKSRAVTTGRSL
jgi:hypothetical protein